MFNKGEYVGHLEPTIECIEEEKNLHFHTNPDAHTTNSITTQWMMAERVKPDTFEPPHQRLKPGIEAKPEHYWRNMHLNSHKMKPPLEQHL